MNTIWFAGIAVNLLLMTMPLPGSELTLLREVREIHCPGGTRERQIPEFARQLRVNVFIDLGRGWKDDEEDGRGSAYKPSLPRFSFSQGKIKDALDQYCSGRKLRWYYWKDAKAVVLEPADVKIRQMDAKLSGAIGPLETIEVDRDAVSGKGLSFTKVREAWEGLSPQNHVVSKSRSYEAIYNHRHVSQNLFLGENEAPKNILDYIAFFLRQQSGLIVELEIEGQGDAMLYFGSHPEELLDLDPAALVESIVQNQRAWANLNTDERYRHIIALRELYRRAVFQRPQLIKELLDRKVLEQSFELTESMKAWYDPETVTPIFLELLDKSNDAIKEKLLNSNAIPSPLKFGARALPFWEALSKSKNDVFKKAALDLLDYYKKHPDGE